MKKLLLILISAWIAMTGFGQDASHKKNLERINSPSFETNVDSLVMAYTDLDIFSGVVLVAVNGEPVYHKAFGLANREKNIPNTVHTHFDIGSMNKTFTKMVVLQLVDEGKLNLDDKLGQYLDGFSKTASVKITIEMLLNHTSGFGSYASPDYFDSPRSEKTSAGLLERIKKMDIEFEPGTDEMYSNSGYVILGAIIEKITGKTYYDAVEERIVMPLGLKETYLREKYTVPDRAIGYMKSMRGETEDNEFLQEYPNPSGGFYSTTLDMLHFYQVYYYGGKIWDEKVRRLDKFYPFYQQHMTTGGAMVQAGGFEGANTVIFEILRDRISIIVFANMDEPVAENLGAGILDLVRDKDPEMPAEPAIQAVYKAYTKLGIDYVKSHFDALSVNFHPQDPKDLILNNIGYNLLYSENPEEEKQALEIFKLNTELFPEVANCWDSYGEALRKNGKKEAALAAYQKALQIRPDMETAQKAVKELKQE